MTRKCVLCKETNYKNSFSFFSAPKDRETRLKWQEAIGIDDYIVGDDTYVCSKHFSVRDIITHWASGIPPHVVTIKYKKCRLRPGAIPITNTEIVNDVENNKDPDDDYDLEVNRSCGAKRLITIATEQGEIFQIPRTYLSSDNTSRLPSKSDNIEYENSETDEQEIDNPEKINYEDIKMANQEDEENLTISDQLDDNVLDVIDQDTLDNEESDNTIYVKDCDSHQQILYIETIDENCKTELTEHDINNSNNIKNKYEKYNQQKTDSLNEENDEFNSISLVYSQEDEEENQIIEEIDQNEDEVEEGEDFEVWEHIKTERNKIIDNQDEKSQDAINMEMDTSDPLELTEEYYEEAMLFEDLLDNYTEIKLPNGWCSMVESKGRDTTIIYAFIKTTMNGIPWIEKQVFLQSDMLMRSSAAGKEINPRMHNLIKEEKHVKVFSFDDLTEMIKEFDTRTVCEGSFGKINSTDLDNTIAYRDGLNWRHVDCPVIINNGSNRCSKCSSLNIIANRKKSKPPQTAESAELLKKERTIFILQKLLKKKSRKNGKKYDINNEKIICNNETNDKEKDILTLLDTMNIPSVQKIMIKECLKTPVCHETTTDYSESWIFLSLRIYMESQETYEYLLQNNYMSLPSVKIMRRYLNQVKTDTQFYKLFKHSIEKFGFSEEQLGEPT